jgi:hypothetical protein
MRRSLWTAGVSHSGSFELRATLAVFPPFSGGEFRSKMARAR